MYCILSNLAPAMIDLSFMLQNSNECIPIGTNRIPVVIFTAILHPKFILWAVGYSQ